MRALGALISAFSVVLLLIAVNVFNDPDRMGVAGGTFPAGLWFAGAAVLFVGGAAMAFSEGGLSE